MGHQLAKELACRGCSVIMADKVDAKRTVEDLIKETQNPKIFHRIVDFGSFESVRKFADNLKNDFEHLDILFNNVGTGVFAEVLTEDGVQSIMQINYFSHFLLTNLLMGKFYFLENIFDMFGVIFRDVTKIRPGQDCAYKLDGCLSGRLVRGKLPFPHSQLQNPILLRCIWKLEISSGCYVKNLVRKAATH